MSRRLRTVDDLLEDIAREQSVNEYDAAHGMHVFINGDPGVGKTYLYFDDEPTMEEWLDMIDPERTDGS